MQVNLTYDHYHTFRFLMTLGTLGETEMLSAAGECVERGCRGHTACPSGGSGRLPE